METNPEKPIDLKCSLEPDGTVTCAISKEKLTTFKGKTSSQKE